MTKHNKVQPNITNQTKLINSASPCMLPDPYISSSLYLKPSKKVHVVVFSSYWTVKDSVSLQVGRDPLLGRRHLFLGHQNLCYSSNLWVAKV